MPTEKSQRYHQELIILNEIAQEISSYINQDTILRHICDRITSFNIQMCWVGLVDPYSLQVRSLASAGFGVKGYLSGPKDADASSPTSTAIRTKKPFIINDFGDPQYTAWREEASKYGYQSSLTIPIIFRSQVLGVLNLYRAAKNGFGDEDIFLFRVFTYPIGIALNNAFLCKSLLQTEKLASVGQMASGVAHELNTPLAVILGITQMLMMDMKDEAVKSELQKVEKSALNSLEIIKKLLVFSRKGSFSLNSIDINRLIDETLVMVKKLANFRNTKVSRKFTNGLPQIMANQRQIQQVFLNLINNANQAMPEGGDLTISTGLSADRKYAVVEFKDTGCGISPENKAKVFEPFFTTKPAGQGTGLGLSVSLEIISRYGGTIEAASEPGKGSTFTVRMPVAALFESKTS